MKASGESSVCRANSAEAKGTTVNHRMEDVFRVVGTWRQVEMRICGFGIEVCLYVRVCKVNKSVQKRYRVRGRGYSELD